MRLGVVQLEATWNDSNGVLARVERLLQRGPKTDLVLLPEAALTGYVSPSLDFDLTRFAEAHDGPTLRHVSELARRHATTLVVPSIVAADGGVYNAMTAVAADGTSPLSYRKRHPWFPETWASAGIQPPPVVEIAGVRTTIVICYDLQFVLEDAVEQLQTADLLLFPSAWVDDADTRIALLQDLARRFELWIAAANWAEGDVSIPGQGGSCIVDPAGVVVTTCGQGDARLDATVPL